MLGCPGNPFAMYFGAGIVPALSHLAHKQQKRRKRWYMERDAVLKSGVARWNIFSGKMLCNPQLRWRIPWSVLQCYFSGQNMRHKLLVEGCR